MHQVHAQMTNDQPTQRLAGHFKFQDEHHQTEAVLAVRSGAIAGAADMGTASTRLRKHHRPSSRKKNVSHITPRSQPRANKNQGPNEPSCSAPSAWRISHPIARPTPDAPSAASTVR